MLLTGKSIGHEEIQAVNKHVALPRCLSAKEAERNPAVSRGKCREMVVFCFYSCFNFRVGHTYEPLQPKERFSEGRMRGVGGGD